MTASDPRNNGVEEEVQIMNNTKKVSGKRVLLTAAMIALGFAFVSCASDGYNTQTGAAIGAGVGALAGQAIGNNTEGTLIGAAGGALLGAIIGNAADQDIANQRMYAAEQATPPGNAQDAPPGEWVTVPGRWVDGKWVPAHRVWVPVNPAGPPPPPEASSAPYPPPPAYTIPAPPSLVPIPDIYAYFVPGIDVDILFYQGFWYRPFGGRWYGSRFYNGPWGYLGPRAVPPAFRGLPPDFRRNPRGYQPVPSLGIPA